MGDNRTSGSIKYKTYSASCIAGGSEKMIFHEDKQPNKLKIKKFPLSLELILEIKLKKTKLDKRRMFGVDKITDKKKKV